MDFHPDILGAKFALGMIRLHDIFWIRLIRVGVLNERKDVEAMIKEGGNLLEIMGKILKK